MPTLRINDKPIQYDSERRYLTISVIGGGFGRENYGIHEITPSRHLGYRMRRQLKEEGLRAMIKEELSSIEIFLTHETHVGLDSTCTLKKDDIPSFNNTQELYKQVLSALEKE